MLVVVRLKILGWMHQLDGRPELIDVEMPARERQDEPCAALLQGVADIRFTIDVRQNHDAIPLLIS